jgi:hypothetical protein
MTKVVVPHGNMRDYEIELKIPPQMSFIKTINEANEDL